MSGGFADEPGEALAAAVLVLFGLFVVPVLGVVEVYVDDWVNDTASAPKNPNESPAWNQ
ncbi:hypothetical protein [Kitasatospora sp. NPDC056731]|uniref:hypothetical protein n=1 Tax=Kitasatospora sp. NPDC056731 TaxID=3155422 RepID=UPI003426D24C